MRYLILSIALLLSSSAFARSDATSYRCGNALAQLGDSLYEVQDKCGRPDGEYHWTQSRASGNYSRQGGEYRSRTDQMVRMTYSEYGKFDVYLIFRNGRMVKIEQGRR